MKVFGVDINKSSVDPLRLWMHEEGNLMEGNMNIPCGLKVAFETYWDDFGGKNIPNMNGRMLVECTKLTTVEDVTHVEAIMAIF